MVPPRMAWPRAPTSTLVGLGISVELAEVANGASSGEISMSSVNGLRFAYAFATVLAQKLSEIMDAFLAANRLTVYTLPDLNSLLDYAFEALITTLIIGGLIYAGIHPDAAAEALSNGIAWLVSLLPGVGFAT